MNAARDKGQDLALRIEALDVFLFRAPADPPVQTSFGLMRDRPALLLRVTEANGAQGWGEVWCNFPTVGAEHRARLALATLRPLVQGRRWPHPRQAFEQLTGQLAVLALQSGEPGPLQQVLAGLDTALWDLAARRAGLPLWRLLHMDGRDAPDAAATALDLPPPIPVYASGLNPTAPEKLAAAKLAEGYRAFKLKIGFGQERDETNLRALRETIGPALPLMVDANQAWTLPEAMVAARRLEPLGLGWLEEPLRADAPPAQWAALAALVPGLPLAGGENLAGLPQFESFITQGGNTSGNGNVSGMQVLQPDLGKWGGFSGCLAVGRLALRHGKRFCPHWLGGGIGLMASLHLKAAVGGPGFVEVDANPNPLRELLARPAFTLADGAVQLTDQPGLGVLPDLEACQPYRIDIPASGL